MNLEPPKAHEVHDGKSFAAWAQAHLGVPGPTAKDFPILNKKAKTLFLSHPGTDWQTIVQVAQWCQSKKRRCARVWGYIDQYRYAWAAHAIELPRPDPLADEINAAIEQELDPNWRSRLRRAAGSVRSEVLIEWSIHHEADSAG